MSDNFDRFARMAARAKERVDTRRASEEAAEQIRLEHEFADFPRKLAACWADMTLGEAAKIHSGPGFACACTGPVIYPAPPWAPCACALTQIRVHSLIRAAHITANLMLQVVQKT